MRRPFRRRGPVVRSVLLHSGPVRALPRSIRVAAVAAGLALASVACGVDGPAAADAGPVFRVAVLQYGDVEDPIVLVSPSALAVELVIDQAIARGQLAPDSGLSIVETAGMDPAEVEEAVRSLATDPTIVAAVVTPFVDAPRAERAFLDAGVPVFSFSGLGGVPDSPVWRRLVPTAADEAAAIADLAGPEPCVAAGTSVAPPVPGIDVGSSPGAVADHVGNGDCSGVAWLGGTDGAIELATALGSASSGLPLVVGAAARTDRLASEGYPATEGIEAVVPCRSVTVATESEARRFVHAYQAGHGVPPGLCAAQGFGLGRWLVEQASRPSVAEALATGPELPTPGGALDLTAGAVHAPAVERVVGVRWLPQGMGG